MARRGNSEGTIYRRESDGRWCAALSVGGSKRRVLYGKTRQEVARKLTTALRERDLGTLALGPRQTVRQFFTHWLQDVVRPTAKPRTYETYEERIRLHLLPKLGHLQLARLTPQHLQELWARKLSDGLSTTTVNHVHFVVHKGLKQALRWGLVARNVAEFVDPPRRRPADPSPLTTDEVERLLIAIKGHRDANFWTTLLTTGLRFGEAAGLQSDDLDLDGRTLSVRHTLARLRGGRLLIDTPKTAKSRRTVPLPDLAIEALRNQGVRAREAQLLAGGRWTPNHLVFSSSRGTPLREAHVLNRLHRVLAAAGISRHSMHDLRVTYSTNLAVLGVHPRVAQELLGHSRIDTTMRIYTAAVPSAMRDAADQLDRLYSRAS